MQCDTPSLRFMYVACEDYVEACEWGEPMVGLSRPPTFRRFISREEACRRFGIDQKWLNPLIEGGKLGALRHPSRPGVLIDAESFRLLQMSLCDLLSLPRVALILDIGTADAEDLIHEDCLKPLSGPTVDGLPEWRFDSGELVDLIDRIGDTVVVDTPAPLHSLIAARAAIRQMKARGFGAGHTVRAILEGEIVAQKGLPPFRDVPCFEFAKDCAPKVERMRLPEREYVEGLDGGHKVEQSQPFDFKLRALALENRRSRNLRMHSRRIAKRVPPELVSLEVSDLARTAREVFSRIAS